MKKIYYLLSSLLIFQSCGKDSVSDNVEYVPNLDVEYSYSELELPSFLPSTTNNGFINQTSIGGAFTNNTGILVDGEINFNSIIQINDAKANLGRVLFYDKKLSINNTISCGSCHHQSKAFADGLKVSTGFEGRKTSRNSMAILNPILQNNLFWDSRTRSIHQLALEPVRNHIEMGMENIEYLSKKLASTSYYPALFEKAFGSPHISGAQISQALSQFIASITSANSTFDKVMAGEETFSELEQIGHDLFFSERFKCGSCHAGSNFSAPDGIFDTYGGSGGTVNIGLDVISTDRGFSDGRFKIPSLRNIALTGPYMHDGRFATLDQVLDHYSNGIKNSQSLDPKFKNLAGEVAPLKMGPFEKNALIAFLNTLTDEKLTTDPKYSDPFSY